MIWEDIRLVINGFVIGAAVGYLGHPVWDLVKKIIHEAKVAKHEWRNPNK